jgi:2-keto-3-deoxy-L-rhamnonate aldolase RhmA
MRAREPLVGTVITSADPLLAEVIGSRFDLAWIDLEHSGIDVAAVPVLAMALAGAGCATLVRLPDDRFERLAAVLDAGVDGVVIPRIARATDAAAVVARTRYPPSGTRGYAARRAALYGLRDDRRDEPPVCLVQIESRSAVASAGTIASTDGVDALVVGIADLALDLGVAPDLDEPDLGRALAAVREAANTSDVRFGIAAGGDPQAIMRAAGGRPDVVVYSADARIYAHAVDDAVARLGAALRDPSPTTPRSG